MLKSLVTHFMCSDNKIFSSFLLYMLYCLVNKNQFSSHIFTLLNFIVCRYSDAGFRQTTDDNNSDSCQILVRDNMGKKLTNGRFLSQKQKAWFLKGSEKLRNPTEGRSREPSHFNHLQLDHCYGLMITRLALSIFPFPYKMCNHT